MRVEPMKDFEHRAAPWLVIGAILLCVPCMVPVLAVLVGAGAFSALGAWLSDDTIIAALGATGALAAATLAAYAFLVRPHRGASCGSADALAPTDSAATRGQGR
jgi:hypothetical protein